MYYVQCEYYTGKKGIKKSPALIGMYKKTKTDNHVTFARLQDDAF